MKLSTYIWSFVTRTRHYITTKPLAAVLRNQTWKWVEKEGTKILSGTQEKQNNGAEIENSKEIQKYMYKNRNEAMLLK